jgi:hypothetical protein
MTGESREPDRGGAAFEERLATSSVRDRLYLVRLDGAKDVSELHIQDPKRFMEALRAAFKRARRWADEACGPTLRVAAPREATTEELHEIVSRHKHALIRHLERERKRLEPFSKRMNLSEKERSAVGRQPAASKELRADGSSCIRANLFARRCRRRRAPRPDHQVEPRARLRRTPRPHHRRVARRTSIRMLALRRRIRQSPSPATWAGPMNRGAVPARSLYLELAQFTQRRGRWILGRLSGFHGHSC